MGLSLGDGLEARWNRGRNTDRSNTETPKGGLDARHHGHSDVPGRGLGRVVQRRATAGVVEPRQSGEATTHGMGDATVTYTYDLNTGGVLIIRATSEDVEWLKELRAENEARPGLDLEAEALESLLANSELEWVRPEEIGALTDAPILGIRTQRGKVKAAWGYMSYAVRSFVDDLIDEGKAVFTS